MQKFQFYLFRYASVLERKDAHIKELEQAKESVQAELDQANKRVEDAEGIASSFQKTQQNLHDQLQTTSDHLNIREQQLQEALAQNANLQGQLETMSEDRNNYAVLLEENKGLKEKLSDTQNAAHRDVAEQKAKILRLNADLNNLQKELRDKETEHQNEIAQLKQNLLEVENAKVVAEETLQTARSKAADMSMEEQVSLELTLNILKMFKGDSIPAVALHMKSERELFLPKGKRAPNNDVSFVGFKQLWHISVNEMQNRN